MDNSSGQWRENKELARKKEQQKSAEQKARKKINVLTQGEVRR